MVISLRPYLFGISDVLAWLSPVIGYVAYRFVRDPPLPVVLGAVAVVIAFLFILAYSLTRNE